VGSGFVEKRKNAGEGAKSFVKDDGHGTGAGWISECGGQNLSLNRTGYVAVAPKPPHDGIAAIDEMKQSSAKRLPSCPETVRARNSVQQSFPAYPG
jgi:hypothetical protein